MKKLLQSLGVLQSHVENDHFDVDYDPAYAVTKATADTFTRKATGLGADIAYLDEGAALYDSFIRAHQNDNGSKQSEAAGLIEIHKSALAREMADSQRLIAIGTGSYNSFMNQELALVKEILRANPKAPLTELLLIDVSEDFLRESRRAAQEVSAEFKGKFSVKSIRADFKKIAGAPFDMILEKMGMAPRQETEATVIMTGATFGNLTDVATTDALPIHEIDEQMARIGEFVGDGSTVMFDFFTQIENRPNYYNTPELAAFITNIPKIMADHSIGLKNFHINGDPSKEEEIYFSYGLKSYWKSRLIAHQLVPTQPQQATLVNGVQKGLTIDSPFNVIYSLLPRVEDISYRPSSNTGLKSKFHVSNEDLTMLVAKKVKSDVSALNNSDVLHHSVDAKSYAPSESVNASGVMRMVVGHLTNFGNTVSVHTPPTA